LALFEKRTPAVRRLSMGKVGNFFDRPPKPGDVRENRLYNPYDMWEIQAIPGMARLLQEYSSEYDEEQVSADRRYLDENPHMADAVESRIYAVLTRLASGPGRTLDVRYIMLHRHTMRFAWMTVLSEQIVACTDERWDDERAAYYSALVLEYLVRIQRIQYVAFVRGSML
jgi:hypothetical protein